MKHQTAIDTIGLQIDCNDAYTQRERLDGLIGLIHGTASLYLNYRDYFIGANIQRREYYIYSNNIIVATINTGAFRTIINKDNGYVTKYYVSIKFAGLKSYNEALDRASNKYLLNICAYLNTYRIVFKITELDICIDAECAFEHILAICTKKSPNTQYYSHTEKQTYDTTAYIEKITKKKLDKAVQRAYTYDKRYKEDLTHNITRFEIKLQPKYFNKNGFNLKSIEKALNKYHVMYFENIEEKNSKIEAYYAYQTVRKREAIKLEFEKYRLYANMHYINNFIGTILNYEKDYKYPNLKS